MNNEIQPAFVAQVIGVAIVILMLSYGVLRTWLFFENDEDDREEPIIGFECAKCCDFKIVIRDEHIARKRAIVKCPECCK